MPASRASPISAAELRLLRSLVKHEVPFMMVGAGAAVAQGADLVTKDIDLWFQSTSHPGVQRAARDVGATFIWRMTPQMFSGEGLDDIDVVNHCDGLDSFEEEFKKAVTMDLAPGLTISVLPIERVLASKKAAGRRKDLVAIPALEAAIAVIKGKQAD